MRVVLINLWDKSGMLHYATQLANGLARLPGINLTVVLPQSTPFSSLALFVPEVEIRFTDVITQVSLEQIVRLPKQVLGLPNFYRDIVHVNPDVIHIAAHHVWFIPVLPWLHRKFPVVSTLHDVVPHPGLDDNFHKAIEIRTLVNHSDGVFVHGRRLKGSLLASYPGLNSDRVHIIPHGDYAFFRCWSKGRSEEPGSILFFGRIRDYKGLPYLLDAYSQVVEELKPAKLILVGEGPLDELAAKLDKLPNCEIRNSYVPDEEVSQYFERASLVVCPYTEASQSGVVPIAYAFKKPVIVTRVGCLPDYVEDGGTGLIVDPGDSRPLAFAIIKLLGDPGLRKQMGEKGWRKMVAELSWEQIAQTTVKTYHEAIKRREIQHDQLPILDSITKK